jgi:hypothetical protein
LLLKFLSTGHHFNLFLCAHEGVVVLVFCVRAAKDRLSFLDLHLALHVGVVSVVKAGRRVIKLCAVPLFKRADQLLLDGIDLSLTLTELHLAVLKCSEVVSVDLLQVLHLAEHDQLLFVDNLFSLLLKHVVLA